MEALTLFELNNMVRSVLEQTLDDVYWLEAELSEARMASNGHFYVEFIQKDGTGHNLLAKARGTMWARTYHLLAPLFEKATGERLRAGMKVRVEVSVEFHELYGYSLNIHDIDPAYTLGDMAKRRREILEQLAADGILEDNQQLQLPALLKRIAVISSAGAAGYGDFCNQLAHNDYGLHFDLQLFPAVMQGANVEDSVLAALAAIADEAERWDCAVIIRGGGATSDLSDFDSYPLAAAVAQMPIPVIVGIGHERDETVLDFVAHTRVKTPTAAAAFLIGHGADQLATLEELQNRLTQHARYRIETSKQQLTRLATFLPHAFALIGERQRRRLQELTTRFTLVPQRHLFSSHNRLEVLQGRFSQAAKLKLQRTQLELKNWEQRIALLDPTLLLKRGYSLTYNSDGQILREATNIREGDLIRTRLAKGEIESIVHATTSVRDEQRV